MTLFNATKGVILAEKAAMADTFLKRLCGLLGKKELAKGQALIIKPCTSIHTFFMRFPIDVIFADKNNRIISVMPTLVPFRLSKLYFNASYAVELPSGLAKATSTSAGDLLKVE